MLAFMSDHQITIGQVVPDFTLPASGGESISLSSFKGKNVVIYFYPKDATPGCTQEACDFRDQSAIFAELNTVVLGISGDKVSSHDKFAAKHTLTFPLLSDEEHVVSEQFGVWQLKKMYGREYEGIVRSTFLIDEAGVLVKEWRKVSVKGHVEEVVKAVKELNHSNK